MKGVKSVIKREIEDMINGYALPKLLFGFGLWRIAIQQFECGNVGASIIVGVVAICILMEAIRLLRGWRGCK